jgi:hypothetical protein
MSLSDAGRRPAPHTEEWFSILLALIGTIGASIFIGYYPDYKPSETGGVAWAVPVWIGFLYLIVQITFLLFSASQVRALGVLDSVLAIAPVVAGLVLLVQIIISSTFKDKITPYQINSLAVLIVAGASEFLLTIWIRFVINRRTIGFGGGDN